MFCDIAPSGRIGELVDRLWVAESEPAAGAERRLPTGRVELVLNLDEDRFSIGGVGDRRVLRGCVVVGPTSRWFVLDRAQQRNVAGVCVRPGAVRALLGVSAHELAGRHVALEELWGSAAAELRERLLEAPDGPARLLALEEALGDRVGGRERAHPLLAAALSRLSDPAPETIGEMGVALGWTQRRVEQVFRSEVGLPPAVFRRLQRFRVCLRAVDRAAEVGWSAFALEYGYCDQSHLIREFRAHCGLSPSGYMTARGPALNHVTLAS